jgi:hypothetical protein
MIVYISSLASKATAKAAEALSTGLVKTLPPSSNKMLVPEDPKWFESLVSRGMDVDGTAPYVIAAKDPDLITVLIATHPQQ